MAPYISKTTGFCLKIWFLCALFQHHYYFFAIIYYLHHSPELNNKWLLSNMVVHIACMLSSYKIISHWKIIATYCMDIFKLCHKLNSKAFASNVKKLKFSFGFLLGYEAFLLTSLLLMKMEHYMTKEKADSKWIQTLCMGLCNENRNLLNFIVLIDCILYVSLINGPLLFFTIMYCFVAASLTLILKSANEKFQSKLLSTESIIERTISAAKKDLNHIQQMVNWINSELRYIVLLWLVAGFILACHGCLKFITRLTQDLNPYLMYYDFFFHFQMLFIVLLSTYFGSRIPEEVEKMMSFLHAIGREAHGQGTGLKIQLLFWQLNNPKTALKAGDCFYITFNLFISYLGLGITYAVIFIQINPQVLKSLQVGTGMSKHENN